MLRNMILSINALIFHTLIGACINSWWMRMDSRERQVKSCHTGIACCQTVPGKATAAQPPLLPTQAGCICEDGGACWCPKAKFYPADENMDGWLVLCVRHFHIVIFNEAVPSTPCMSSYSPALYASLEYIVSGCRPCRLSNASSPHS